MNGKQREGVIQLTLQYAGEWGMQHTRRLLANIAILGEGLAYDQEVVWVAAHLHDWGATATFAQEGVEHAERSRQVAEAYLREQGYADAFSERVLACIATHHSGDPQRSLEAILLSDADGLDFLGAIGLARDFSKNPRQLRKGYDSLRKRMREVPGRLSLERAKSEAARRLEVMEAFMAALERESHGFF